MQVTNLMLTRPKRFNYQPGDYIFLKIPAIAKYEWHPFTISSSPEQDFLGLHIRSVGTWTNKLYDFVKDRPRITPRYIHDTHQNLPLEANSPDVTTVSIDSQGSGSINEKVIYT